MGNGSGVVGKEYSDGVKVPLHPQINLCWAKYIFIGDVPNDQVFSLYSPKRSSQWERINSFVKSSLIVLFEFGGNE